MSLALLLVAFAAAAASSDIPNGRASFQTMSDLEIDGWLRWNGFYHSVNVYRCRGFSQRVSGSLLTRFLGRTYDARGAAIGNALKARYPDTYIENPDYLAVGYRVTPSYCRRIRFVAQDLLRGTAELEHRLGLVQ